METPARFVVLHPELPSDHDTDEERRHCASLVAEWSDGREIVGEFRVTAAACLPVVNKAIARARRRKATVILPTLPLLRSSLTIIFELRSSGVPFDVLEMPRADELFAWMLPALDQARSVRHGERTRRGVQAARERGARLGTPANLTDDARRLGAEARSAYARDDEHNRTAAWYCAVYMNEGKSLAWIADRLNEMKLTTRRGARWSRANLHRVWTTYRDTVIEPTMVSIRAVKEMESREGIVRNAAPPRRSNR